MNKSNKFSPEVRERAVRIVQEHRKENSSLPARNGATDALPGFGRGWMEHVFAAITQWGGEYSHHRTGACHFCHEHDGHRLQHAPFGLFGGVVCLNVRKSGKKPKIKGGLGSKSYFWSAWLFDDAVAEVFRS